MSVVIWWWSHQGATVTVSVMELHWFPILSLKKKRINLQVNVIQIGQINKDQL